MLNKILRVAIMAIAAAAMTIASIGNAEASNSNQASDKVIKIGYVNWSQAIFIAKLTKKVLEKRTNYKVKLKKAAVGVVYRAVAEGNLDFTMVSWLPHTHKLYIKQVGNKLEDLGILYEGAKQGWVVPDYIPKSQLNSIPDLHKKSVHAKLGGTIQGIDPGAGLMQSSKKALKAYNLKSEYKLKAASGPAMTAELARAEKHNKWIVVTGWKPHWMWGKWNLRFLKDPKGEIGVGQHVDIEARPGFRKDHPKLARILGRMNLNLPTLEKYMYEARQTSDKKAVNKYIANNQARINSWFYTNAQLASK